MASPSFPIPRFSQMNQMLGGAGRKLAARETDSVGVRVGQRSMGVLRPYSWVRV